MIRKILCWLGWHKWKIINTTTRNPMYSLPIVVEEKRKYSVCKHCGKVRQ